MSIDSNPERDSPPTRGSASVNASDDDTSTLMALDKLLAEHPFGNSSYITSQLHRGLIRRLDTIRCESDIVAELVELLSGLSPRAVYPVLGDPVLRCAIEHGYIRQRTGRTYGFSKADCDSVFRAAIRQIAQGMEHGLLRAGLEPLGAGPFRAGIWRAERADPLAQMFMRLVDRVYPGDLYTPSNEEMKVLRQGFVLLHSLLPACAASALKHVHIVAVFDWSESRGATLSSTVFELSGVIFLSRSLLTEPWKVAEHLFHEALHQQFDDFRRTHSLIVEDSPEKDRRVIHAIWNRPTREQDNHWDVSRAVAAFHVYVHLALLSRMARTRADTLQAEFGPRNIVGHVSAAVRAYYLRDQLREKCSMTLGAAGKRAVEWFDSVLAIVHPNSPAAGACVHLMLERYWREASLVLAAPARAAEGSTTSGKENGAVSLVDLCRSEGSEARDVLASIGADVAEFDDRLRSIWDDSDLQEDDARFFFALREVVTSVMLRVTPADFKLASSGIPDDRVRSMIERSSVIVARYLEGVGGVGPAAPVGPVGHGAP
jgi:hypothetical protein